MSAPNRKTPQPRKSHPSTFMTNDTLLLLRGAERGDGRVRVPGRAPAPDVRVVQVERGPLRPDPWHPVEVVPRWRARRRPLQGGAVAPGVFLGHLLAEPRGDVHVTDEQ